MYVIAIEEDQQIDQVNPISIDVNLVQVFAATMVADTAFGSTLLVNLRPIANVKLKLKEEAIYFAKYLMLGQFKVTEDILVTWPFEIAHELQSLILVI